MLRCPLGSSEQLYGSAAAQTAPLRVKSESQRLEPLLLVKFPWCFCARASPRHLPSQCFSNLNACRSHRRILLKCRFWCCASAVGPGSLHFPRGMSVLQVHEPRTLSCKVIGVEQGSMRGHPLTPRILQRNGNRSGFPLLSQIAPSNSSSPDHHFKTWEYLLGRVKRRTEHLTPEATVKSLHVQSDHL